MENSVFVNKLIKGTKDGNMKWQLAKPDPLYDDHQPYFLQKGDKKLVLEKYDTTGYDGFGDEVVHTNCVISICDNENRTLGQIYEDDLPKSSDLMRLYRLAERQVNNVDLIMEDFVAGVGGIEF